MMLALVVDDDPLIRSLARRAVESAGGVAVEAASADEAAGLLEADGCRLDLVITDVRMPGRLDGIGLAELAGGKKRPPRVIVMSGSGGSLDRARGLPGVAAVVAKPFTVEGLAAVALAAAAGLLPLL